MTSAIMTIPDKELTKEQQAEALKKTPEWQLYVKEVERLLASIREQLDDCLPERIQRIQGEIQGLKTALNLINEIKDPPINIKGG